MLDCSICYSWIDSIFNHWLTDMNTELFRELSHDFVYRIKESRKIISFHKPSIGYVGEEMLRNFIREIIPKEYKVCSGFIKQKIPDSPFTIIKAGNKDDNISVMPQCDIIIYKNDKNALEFECGDIAVVNKEFVHMVIEVKSSIGPKNFEKTLKDFELINISHKVLFIYTAPTVQTIRKYFYNRSAYEYNENLKIIEENNVIVDGESTDKGVYIYDHDNFNDLPNIIVSLTPNKEFFLSKDYVVLEDDYLGYNSIIFEDSKNKHISCLQELACYIDISFGGNNYIVERTKISDYYAIPLFQI